MIYTEAAQTVVAKMTEMAEESEAATATVTPEPSVTAEKEIPTATTSSSEEEEEQATPTKNQQDPTQSGPCTLSADYIADVTYPDDAVVAPGETFMKTWQIMNSGSCTWDADYTIYFVSGDNLGAPENASLTGGIEVPPGTIVNVSVQLTAPTEEGTYRSDFKFKDQTGKSFGTGGGGTIYIQIKVAEPTPEPSNTPAATETPVSTETPTVEPTVTPTP